MERQATPRRRPLHPYTPQLRVLSWNVNGIRAQMEKEEGRKVQPRESRTHSKLVKTVAHESLDG